MFCREIDTKIFLDGDWFMSYFSLAFSSSNLIYCKVIILVDDAQPLSFPINLR